jgi:hypothetical protein
VVHWPQWPSRPAPPPQKRKSDKPAGKAVASRSVVPKKRDPRQAGIFDAPLPAFIRSQLAKLVTEAPGGERWAHELNSMATACTPGSTAGGSSSSPLDQVSIGRATTQRRPKR